MTRSATALVDAAWAQEHLDDPNVRFVEVDVDTEAYLESHVPGAVGWNWTSQLSDGIRRDVASREDFTALLRQSGIGPGTTIVLYGDNNNWFAAWAYWQLKLFGWEDVRILDGGRKYWLANGLPLATDVPSYAETDVDLPEPDFTERAFRDDVLRHVEAGGALVDVRSPAEFSGELLHMPDYPQEGALRGGHIPGAASKPWKNAANDDGTFKDADALRKIYAEELGLSPDDDVVVYCRIGERSSHTWFVLQNLLGYPTVRNYDGSWTEWGNLVKAPVER